MAATFTLSPKSPPCWIANDEENEVVHSIFIYLEARNQCMRKHRER